MENGLVTVTTCTFQFFMDIGASFLFGQSFQVIVRNQPLVKRLMDGKPQSGIQLKAPNHSGGKASGGNRASTSQDNPSPAPAPTISRHLKENASPQIPAVTKHTVEEVSGWAKAKESVAACADDAWKTIKRTAKSVVEGAWNVVGGIGTQVLYTAGSIPATALNLFSLGVRQTRSGLEIYQKWDAVETWKKMVFEDLSPAMGFDTQSIAFNAGRIATAIDLAFTGIGSMFSGLGTGAVVLAGEGAIETVVVIENGAAIVVGDIILVNNLKSGVEILQSNSRSKREEKKKNNKKEASKNGPLPVKEPVKASNGLYYQSNAKHTLGQMGNKLSAGIEPSNSLELFENSIESPVRPDVRFAYDELTGTLHRFFNDGNGVWHWSGSTNQGSNSLTGDQIPIEIKRLFKLRRKGW